MKRVLLLLATVGLGLAPCTGALQTTESKVLPIVKASVSTAGPYGESWYLTLTPEGQVSLQVFYSSRPSGNLLAHFNLGEERVLAVKEALAEAEFFDLPEKLEPSPVAMHRPHLTIEVYLGARHHTSTLYDPEALVSEATTERFLAVWQRLFEALPFQPSW